jgi:hypothetical protein
MAKALAVDLKTRELKVFILTDSPMPDVVRSMKTEDTEFALARDLRADGWGIGDISGSLVTETRISKIKAGAQITVTGHRGGGRRHREQLREHESVCDILHHYGRGYVEIKVEEHPFSLESWVYVYRQPCSDYDCDEVHTHTELGENLIYIE